MDLGRALIDELAITPPEFVALVGAGGKTTLMQALYAEAVRRGWRAFAGTTTKVYQSQVAGLGEFIHGWSDGEKLIGADPAVFAMFDADLIVVEADGARSMRVKAPAVHEPVIPDSATLVVAVIAADALDRVIEDVAHRPMRVAAVCGCSPYDRLTVERAATLLASGRGGRKGVSTGARYAVAITRIGPDQQALSDQLAEALEVRQIESVRLAWVDDAHAP